MESYRWDKVSCKCTKVCPPLWGKGADVVSNLTGEEMKKLREYPLCPSKTDPKRMVLSQLYEPNRDLEKLELPIISWPIDVAPRFHLPTNQSHVETFLQKHGSYMPWV